MTKNPHIAGLAAGGVAALLYLSLATGSGMGLLLFYLAPLPGFIAGFGWGVRAAGTAALAGTALIIASLGLTPALAYAASLAIPSVLLTHFAFLSRVVEPDPAESRSVAETETETAIEWYPVGNLVMITAMYGGLLATFAIFLLGPSYEAYLAKIGAEIDMVMSKASETGFIKKLSPDRIEQYKHLVQTALPASTAVLWSLFALINMWIAAHIVRVSELLARPWPELARIEFSQKHALALILVVALSLALPGLAGLIISAYAGALLLVFLLLGLAVVHYISRPWPARGLFLFATYVAVVFIGWGALVLVVVGLVEPFLQIRRRFDPPPTKGSFS